MPKISVIVPIYKVEPYLRRCVDSLLAQTFGDFEIILVDDGSPDACGQICDDYAEKHECPRVAEPSILTPRVASSPSSLRASSILSTL